MTISSIVDIVDGTLLYKPFVSRIYHIKTDIDNIIQGDLFIAKNLEDLNSAIEKGCFAIIYDFKININDINHHEIALIKVDNVIKSIFKLIRFKLININIETYLCNDIKFELLNIFIKKNDKNIKLISDDVYNNIELLNNIEKIKYIFCNNEEILNNIYPTYKTFDNNIYSIKNIIYNSLFKTTFTYNNKHFHKIKISRIYINDFLKVYNFFNDNFNDNIDLNKLKYFDYLNPIFINKYFKEISNENSSKFILYNANIKIALKEIKYLNENYKYAKKHIFIQNKLEINNNNNKFYFIKNLKEIETILKDREYNCIYIIGFNKNKIIEFIQKSSDIKSIFDI